MTSSLKLQNETKANPTSAGICISTEACMMLGCVTIGVALIAIAALSYKRLLPGINSHLQLGSAVGGCSIVTISLLIVIVKKCCCAQANGMFNQAPQSGNKLLAQPIKPLPPYYVPSEDPHANLQAMPSNVLNCIFDNIEVADLGKVARVSTKLNKAVNFRSLGAKKLHARCIANALKCCEEVYPFEETHKHVEGMGARNKKSRALYQIAERSGKWWPKKTEEAIQRLNQIATGPLAYTLGFKRLFAPLILEAVLADDAVEKKERVIQKLKNTLDTEHPIHPNARRITTQLWYWMRLALKMMELNEKEIDKIFDQNLFFKFEIDGLKISLLSLKKGAGKQDVIITEIVNSLVALREKVSNEEDSVHLELAIACLTNESLDKTLEEILKVPCRESRKRMQCAVVLALAARSPYVLPDTALKLLNLIKDPTFCADFHGQLLNDLAFVRAKAAINLAIKERSLLKQNSEEIKILNQRTLACARGALAETVKMDAREGTLFKIFTLFLSYDRDLALEFANKISQKWDWARQTKLRAYLLLDCLKEDPHSNLAVSETAPGHCSPYLKTFKRLLEWNPAAAQQVLNDCRDPVVQVIFWCEKAYFLGDKTCFEEARKLVLKSKKHLATRLSLLHYIFEKEGKTSPTLESAQFLLNLNAQDRQGSVC